MTTPVANCDHIIGLFENEDDRIVFHVTAAMPIEPTERYAYCPTCGTPLCGQAFRPEEGQIIGRMDADGNLVLTAEGATACSGIRWVDDTTGKELTPVVGA